MPWSLQQHRVPLFLQHHHSFREIWETSHESFSEPSQGPAQDHDHGINCNFRGEKEHSIAGVNGAL